MGLNTEVVHMIYMYCVMLIESVMFQVWFCTALTLNLNGVSMNSTPKLK